MKNNFNIENNVIILTGGSGNLGSIYAEYLISNGAKVCNFDLTSPKDINKFDEIYSGERPGFLDGYKKLKDEITPWGD